MNPLEWNSWEIMGGKTLKSQLKIKETSICSIPGKVFQEVFLWESQG